MAHFGKDVDNFSATRTIRIVGAETNEKFTVRDLTEPRANDFPVLFFGR